MTPLSHESDSALAFIPPYGVACPRCGAERGHLCRNVSRSYQRGRKIDTPHPARRREARKARMARQENEGARRPE